MEGKPVRVIDLRTLTHEEFLSQGRLLNYKIRRMPTVTVRKVDGLTETAGMLRLDESEMPLEIKFRSRGEMMLKSDGNWILLEPGFLESWFDFISESEKEIFKRGDKASCRDKPWSAIMLHEDVLIITRKGEEIQAGSGDYIAEYRSDVPWYYYVSYQQIGMGGYAIIHGA